MSSHHQSVELRQLAYFDAVVRTGGFTRAAEQLHVAQPAVSVQIRRLESELGVRLLDRTTRRVALTHAGELFLARARRALGELEAGRGDLADLAGVLRGRIVLGATAVLGSFDLPAALAGFAARHPGVELSLRSGLLAPMLTELDAGGLDLVLGPVEDDLPDGYRADPLDDERLVVVTPPGHRLGRTPRIGLAELAGDPFVCLPAGTGLRALLDTAATAAGVVPRVQFEAPTPHVLRTLVSAGLGVAVTPASAVAGPGAPLTVHELDDAPPHPPYGLIHSAGRPLTPAARTLRRHVLDGAAGPPR